MPAGFHFVKETHPSKREYHSDADAFDSDADDRSTEQTKLRRTHDAFIYGYYTHDRTYTNESIDVLL